MIRRKAGGDGQAQQTGDAVVSGLQRHRDQHRYRCDVQRVPWDGEDMKFPPDRCAYEVRYTLGRRGAGLESFPDEYSLGRWFSAMAAEGMFTPEDFQVPDEDGRNGYQIFCVTEAGRVGISYFHPRLVRGRIEGAQLPI